MAARSSAAALVGLLLCVACARQERDRPSKSAGAAAPAEAAVSGEQVYADYCAVCHMASGLGVPNFQPPLVGSDIVAGDRQRLENVIRGGSYSLQDRENPYGTEMPPFGTLTEGEMEALIDFMKEKFVEPGA